MRRWLDILLGRTRPARPKREHLFAMATAYVTLDTKLGYRPGERAGIVFRPVTSSYFQEFERELQGILALTHQEMGTQPEFREDTYGFRWVVLHDEDFEDLVATIHQVSQILADHGFGEQALAAVFRFDSPQGRPVYWIYQYKRGAFSPFAPAGRGQERDNATELRLRAVMEHELPIEADLGRWYALWGIPL
ncbi:MAG: hypothetical protein HY689_15965 [Chloroflexi bacterium]|nr:hypothetical protein [Chloroflexota bacterium]